MPATAKSRKPTKDEARQLLSVPFSLTRTVRVPENLRQCINPGSNKPKAGNKQSFSSTSNVPVQNGKANFSEDLTATFQPDCTPPMTVEFSNVVVTVTAADGTRLVHRFSGTF
jgi:hypothetical protein